MEINCEFDVRSIYTKKLYTCIIVNANITVKDHVIKEFKGIHKKGKSHEDIKNVWFYNTTIDHFPRGLQKHFLNLTHLDIFGGGIREISKMDLRGFEELVGLRIVNCQLTSLPDDLFSEMTKLCEVSFVGNKIELFTSEVLKPLLGRENVKVDLRGNKSIDAQFWPGSIHDSLKSLEELMKLIDEKIDADLVPKIKEMWISGKFSDLTIIGGEKKFKVHKTILGMQSEVFAQFFKDQTAASGIKIADFSS